MSSVAMASLLAAALPKAVALATPAQAALALLVEVVLLLVLPLLVLLVVQVWVVVRLAGPLAVQVATSRLPEMDLDLGLARVTGRIRIAQQLTWLSAVVSWVAKCRRPLMARRRARTCHHASRP